MNIVLGYDEMFGSLQIICKHGPSMVYERLSIVSSGLGGNSQKLWPKTKYNVIKLTLRMAFSTSRAMDLSMKKLNRIYQTKVGYRCGDRNKSQQLVDWRRFFFKSRMA